ncbi:MAG: hypothetical protein WD512_11640 [Candidatus Paceibacterota bacterium]
MGGNISSIKNVADVSVRSESDQILVGLNEGRTSLSVLLSDAPNPAIIFSGEVSSNIKNLTRNVSLEEPNHIRIKYTFKLSDIFNLEDYDYANRTVQGTGNITFISTATDTVSSIPICLKSLTIDPNIDNLARAVYEGYISRDISLAEGYEMDSCATCFILLKRLDI